MICLFSMIWSVLVADTLHAATRPEVHGRLLYSTAWIRTSQGVGTGWIVDQSKRFMVTNLHVVGDAEKVEAFFVALKDVCPITERNYYLENQKALHEQGRAVRGRVIARREASDLALVELDRLPDGIAALPLCSREPEPGERLHLVGHRQDSEALWVHSVGEVRQRGRLSDGYFWHGKKLAVDAECLIVQAPILIGDSGAPVVNVMGEVVGVLSGLRQAPLAAIVIQTAEVRALLAQAKGIPQKTQDNASAVATIYSKLVMAGAWVRPTATEGRAIGWIFDKRKRLLLTTASGVGPSDRVDMLFPRFKGAELVADLSAYADHIDLRTKGSLVRGVVLHRDTQRDLAMVELDSLPAHVVELALEKDEPTPGENVHAVTLPSGVELLWLYSTGAVRQSANIGISGTGNGEQLKVRTLLLQIPHQAGSSGGAVVNDKGRVIGLLAAKEGPQQQLGFAIASSELETFLRAARSLYSPENAEQLHRLAKLWRTHGRIERAEELMHKALSLEPTSQAIRLDLANTLLDEGNLKETRQVVVPLENSLGV